MLAGSAMAQMPAAIATPEEAIVQVRTVANDGSLA
jgi:hypothetical protein